MIPCPPTTAWRWSLESEIAVNGVDCPRLAKLSSATTPCFPREDMGVDKIERKRRGLAAYSSSCCSSSTSNGSDRRPLASREEGL